MGAGYEWGQKELQKITQLKLSAHEVIELLSLLDFQPAVQKLGY
jgi:hypothetical protein